MVALQMQGYGQIVHGTATDGYKVYILHAFNSLGK